MNTKLYKCERCKDMHEDIYYGIIADNQGCRFLMLCDQCAKVEKSLTTNRTVKIFGDEIRMQFE